MADVKLPKKNKPAPEEEGFVDSLKRYRDNIAKAMRPNYMNPEHEDYMPSDKEKNERRLKKMAEQERR